MPRIRRTELPEAVLRHLLLRARERNISTSQFVELASWLNSDPNVPAGRWFKRFASFAICGEGELVKTFLLPGQVPDGLEVL
jgi:hypothetical protein